MIKKNVAPSFEDLLSRLNSSECFNKLTSSLKSNNTSVCGGLWGSSSAMVCASLFKNANALCVAPSTIEAESFVDDLQAFGIANAMLLPAWDVLPCDTDRIETDILASRASTLRAISQEPPLIVVAPAMALMQPVVSAESLAVGDFELAIGLEVPLKDIHKRLSSQNLRRVRMVETRGEYAIRGGIIDVWPLLRDAPIRIEFFGDEVDSIREFNPMTQRSDQELSVVSVENPHISNERNVYKNNNEKFSITNHLDSSWSVVLLQGEEVDSHISLYTRSSSNKIGSVLFSFDEVMKDLCSSRRLLRLEAERGVVSDAIEFDVRSVSTFDGDVDAVVKRLSEVVSLSKEEMQTWVLCNNKGERSRLERILKDGDVEVGEKLQLHTGAVSRGFCWNELNVTLIDDAELFGRYRVKRRVKAKHKGQAIKNYLELEISDYVVHVQFGIARYLGIEQLTINDRKEDFLTLLFASDVKVYVPGVHIALVQKYIGGSGAHPALSTYGGKGWTKKKARAKEAIEKLAKELVEMSALRMGRVGIVYPKDDEWQYRFEAAFLYDETDDQLTAIDAIKDDMESTKPMDRLLCGDVGFGKTEVAVRAAFKAVMAGKQVAVLVPTTVLAAQHGRTFKERMADYPIHISVLSRFLSGKETTETVDALRRGQVDIVIGTHRLASADISFKDLGLVIIDEEQRFGVEHKERLKALRSQVDILTMSATPIPRTLHMSLIGLRDISCLMSAPVDRKSINTKVTRFSDDLIRQCILREMNREGQVYFLHNRVSDIEFTADMIRALVPEAKVLVVHGQMSGTELEDRMIHFVSGEVDVLVTTTIIESGLDIPNANTIFINDAQRFGLAQLHQLRGRVGRYRHRGYCYLLTPEKRSVSKTAMLRLRSLEEMSELGAGYRLSLRDLELRGAGNLLGRSQSGAMMEIGYELYCRMVEEVLKRSRGEKIIERKEVSVYLEVDSFIPDEYVSDAENKIEIYRLLSACGELGGIDELLNELRDRYGKSPSAVNRLFDHARIALRAAEVDIAFIGLLDGRLWLKMSDDGAKRLHCFFANYSGDIRILSPTSITLPLKGKAASGGVERIRFVETLLKQMQGACLKKEVSAGVVKRVKAKSSLL